MGVYTSKKDNKVFKTLDGKEVWICDRCEVVFEGSEMFFNHICDKGEIIYPKSQQPERYVLKFQDLTKADGGSEATLRGGPKELVVYLRQWADSVEYNMKENEKK